MALPFDLTVLEKAWYVTSQDDQFQANENRGSIYGVLDTFWQNRNKILSANQLEGLRTAASRPVSIATQKKRALGTGTARVCTPAGAASGSAATALTWSTVQDDFTLSVDQLIGANNYTFQDALAQNFKQMLLSFYSRLDTLAYNFLIANKSAGNGSHYPRSGVNGEIGALDWKLSPNSAAVWVNNVQSEMLQNDYGGPYDVVGSTYLSSIVSAMLNQGAGNQTNSNFQFQNFNFKFSNRVAVDNGDAAEAIIMPQGQVTTLTWTKPKNRIDWANIGIMLGEKRGSFYQVGNELWGTMIEPRYGIEIEMKVKGVCFDNSANIADGQDDFNIGFSMAFDVAQLNAYSSDANTGIYKYRLLLADNPS